MCSSILSEKQCTYLNLKILLKNANHHLSLSDKRRWQTCSMSGCHEPPICLENPRYLWHAVKRSTIKHGAPVRCFRKLTKGALGVRHNLLTLGHRLSPLGTQRPLEKASWRAMGFKPDLKEPIGFGPEDGKEGKAFLWPFMGRPNSDIYSYSLSVTYFSPSVNWVSGGWDTW